MINIEKIKFDIVKKLKPLNPYQIILFGSYAYGSPTKDSDLNSGKHLLDRVSLLILS